MHGFLARRLACLLIGAALALPGNARPAAEAARPAPRDAAEKVQEGNVKNWIEYYERTRPPPARPAGTPPAQTVPPDATVVPRDTPARRD